MNLIRNQNGIAIILAMIMLLIMSVMALTISFMSNVDFSSMANYKRGEEAFLAAESCVLEGRKRFETIGVESLYFQLQSAQSSPTVNSPLVILETFNPSDDPADSTQDWTGPVCRSGPRIFDGSSAPAQFIEIPPPSKVTGRPIRDVSLPSGGAGGAALFPVTFTVVGKDSQDKDKHDTNDKINTGTEIAAGFETFIPGGATNVY